VRAPWLPLTATVPSHTVQADGEGSEGAELPVPAH
jgi:hypothetical protein